MYRVIAVLWILQEMSDMAYGYIDPGTTQSVFALLVPILSLIAVFFGYLLWPLRAAFGKLFRKADKTEAPAAQNQEAVSPE